MVPDGRLWPHSRPHHDPILGTGDARSNPFNRSRPMRSRFSTLICGSPPLAPCLTQHSNEALHDAAQAGRLNIFAVVPRYAAADTSWPTSLGSWTSVPFSARTHLPRCPCLAFSTPYTYMKSFVAVHRPQRLCHFAYQATAIADP